MATALVTGAAGFTGKYLIDELRRWGHSAHGVGLRERPDFLKEGEYSRADMTRPEEIRAVVKAIRPDMVFHLAGISHIARSDSETIYRVNIMSARNLLSAIDGEGLGGCRVILASSANLYGNQAGILTEDTLPMPLNDYSVSKLAMEHMAGIFRERIPGITVVRPFNYTGRGQSGDFLIPKLVTHFKEKRKTILLGNTDVSRDFSDVRDVVVRYVALAEAKNVGWGPFNFCSGRGYTLTDIMKILERLTGHCPQVNVDSSLVRPNEVRHLVGSPDRLDSTIGRIPLHSFEDTLTWMLKD